MKTGLFGGTFNPVHCGHVQTACEILAEFSLDRILFIPARIPVHKHYEGIVSAEDRLQMLRLALAGRPGLQVSDIELRRKEPSYSILTVRDLEQSMPGNEFFFVLGADSFNTLPSWYLYHDLIREVSFIVLNRPGCVIDAAVAALVPDWKIAGNADYQVSSTMIRRKLAAREPVAAFLDPLVLEYINRRGLYEN